MLDHLAEGHLVGVLYRRLDVLSQQVNIQTFLLHLGLCSDQVDGVLVGLLKSALTAVTFTVKLFIDEEVAIGVGLFPRDDELILTLSLSVRDEVQLLLGGLVVWLSTVFS